jgi:uncharacterized protein YaaW (UPF0174 family)
MATDNLYARLFSLTLDSQTVVAQRMYRFMTGHPDAAREMQSMVEEKMRIGQDALFKMGLNQPYDAVLKDVERKVKANKKRLAKI